MPNAHADLFSAVLDCLEMATDRRLTPEQALDSLQPLRAQHADATIDLVWDDESFDGSFHYDALVRPAQSARTISLSVCPDGELPWALRGLQRWRDSELLRVNDVTLAVEQAIAQIEFVWQRPGLMQKLIDSCLVTSELQRRNVQVTRTDIQAALDGLRRQRGLFTAAQMRAWMEASGLSQSGLEELGARIARSTRLRDAVIGAEAENYFATHRADFDEIKLAVLEVNSAVEARAVVESVQAGHVTLFEAAQTLFLRDRDGATRVSFRQDSRQVLADEFDRREWIEDAIDVCAVDDRFLVVHVLAIHASQPSPATTQRVKAKLFQDWLAEQRKTARIEWFWGEAQRTARDRAAN